MPGLLEGVLAAAKARTAAALVKPVVKPNVSKTEVKPKAVVTPKTPSKAGIPKTCVRNSSLRRLEKYEDKRK